MPLSGDGVGDDEIDKLINWIIKEPDLIAITVKNDKVDSEMVKQTENCQKSSLRCIQGLSKLDILLTSMLKTTRSSEALASKAFRIDNNRIIEVDGRTDKMSKKQEVQSLDAY